uniref:GDP-D-glucose phosphorylase 1 n=1 Tax=Eptatretus burgeri TaxID=7764 RepID=A0A8C4R8D0_EPTBU
DRKPTKTKQTSMVLIPNSTYSIPLRFEVSRSDLITNGVSWPSSSLSHFDETLRTAWQSRLDAGLFRYPLRSSPLSRVLSPPHDVRFPFVAQLNPERSSERRPPQRFASVQQPFDHEAFHFGRIPCREVLFELRVHDYLVINVSPLEFGHVLLLPQPGRLLCQALSSRAVRLALRTLLLSAHPGFRVGFNSLRACASVNHLHLHAYYLEHRLPVEWMKLSVIPGLRAAIPLRLALPPASPIPSFAVSVHPEEPGALKKLTDIVCEVVQLMAQCEIAHNVMFTRGEETTTARCMVSMVRAFIWPRKSSPETKNLGAFNVALCELAGHLPVSSREHFDMLCWNDAATALKDQALSEQDFALLQKDVVKLLNNFVALAMMKKNVCKIVM